MWDWISQNAQALTAIGTIALALVGLGTGIVAIQTLWQAKSASIEQTRPYVYAKLEPSLGSNYAWDMVIKNTGKTSAKDLTLRVEPWPEHEDKLTQELKKLCNTPQTLPPGAKFRTYWDIDVPRRDPSKTSGVTNPATVTVRYRGTVTKWRKPVFYEETFKADGQNVGMIPLGDSGVSLKDHEREATNVKLQEILSAIGNLRHDL